MTTKPHSLGSHVQMHISIEIDSILDVKNYSKLLKSD
jgi:hypothetical protein